MVPFDPAINKDAGAVPANSDEATDWMRKKEIQRKDRGVRTPLSQ
jgi:hypothetical protein